jgi:hypothetical protein
MVLIITTAPLTFICGTTAWVMRTDPSRLVSNTSPGGEVRPESGPKRREK